MLSIFQQTDSVRATWVVPCFNERRRLDLDAIRGFLTANPEHKFLFVDDGSTDGTHGCLVDGLQEFPRFRCEVLRLEVNQGKAEAIRAGIRYAQGNVHSADKDKESQCESIGYFDADLATPLNELPRMLEVIERRQDVQVVVGSRLTLAGHCIQRKPWRGWLGRRFSSIASRMFGLRLNDTQCGAKLFRRNSRLSDIFSQPFIDRWLFDVEILARLNQQQGVQAAGCVYEFPLEQWVEVGESRLKSRDFLTAPWTLVRLFLYYRMGWDFVAPQDRESAGGIETAVDPVQPNRAPAEDLPDRSRAA